MAGDAWGQGDTPPSRAQGVTLRSRSRSRSPRVLRLVPNAAAAEEDTQPATDSRRRAPPSPHTPEIDDLAEPEDPILAEVEAQKGG